MYDNEAEVSKLLINAVMVKEAYGAVLVIFHTTEWPSQFKVLCQVRVQLGYSRGKFTSDIDTRSIKP